MKSLHKVIKEKRMKKIHIRNTLSIKLLLIVNYNKQKNYEKKLKKGKKGRNNMLRTHTILKH